MRKVSVFVFIGCAAFLAAFFARTRQDGSSTSRVSVEAPDSAQLQALGVRPGVQLVAYVFGGSHCGFCNKPETKEAFASLRHILTAHVQSGAAYASAVVVGVAVDSDLQEGLRYLREVGTDAFDQISVGSGWQNEHIVRLLRQQHAAKVGVPLVIIVTRPMSATLSPLTMTYGADSIVKVIQGSSQIAEWVRQDASLTTLTSALSANMSETPIFPEFSVRG